MKIIVIAHELDDHTAPVKWALELAGYQVACWPGLSWMEPQQASLHLAQQPQLKLGSCLVEGGDVVWIRRPMNPTLNPQGSEADRKFMQAAYRDFDANILYMLEALAVRCINPYSAARLIGNKSVQLELARRCGLQVPRTLMANSPLAVKEFLSDDSRRVVCKAFTPHVWHKQAAGGAAAAQAFELTGRRLPRDQVLTYAPAIYQEMVVKQFDIRMVLMRRQVYSFALHNQAGTLDWRRDSAEGNVIVKAVDTPSEVKRGVLAFAEKAGICFGSIDFAVDKDNQWWFLEINEQGQFLWLDQLTGDAGLLEKFCVFLTVQEGLTDQSETQQGRFPSFAQYKKSQPRRSLNAADIAAAVASSPYLSFER